MTLLPLYCLGGICVFILLVVVEVRRRRQKKRRLESKTVFEQRDHREPVSSTDIVYSEIADLDCENAKDPIYAEPQNCIYFDVDGSSSATHRTTHGATKTLPEIYDEVYMEPYSTVAEPFLTVMENGHYEA